MALVSRSSVVGTRPTLAARPFRFGLLTPRSTGKGAPPPLAPVEPTQENIPNVVDPFRVPNPPKADVLPDNEVTKPVKETMAWYGPAPETINGRLAMLGFVAAMGAELSSGLPLWQQIASAGGPIIITFGVLIVASFVPIWRGADLNQSSGPFTKWAELTNGRAAMFGLVGLAVTELIKGGALFAPSAAQAADLSTYFGNGVQVELVADNTPRFGDAVQQSGDALKRGTDEALQRTTRLGQSATDSARSGAQSVKERAEEVTGKPQTDLGDVVNSVKAKLAGSTASAPSLREPVMMVADRPRFGDAKQEGAEAVKRAANDALETNTRVGEKAAKAVKDAVKPATDPIQALKNKVAGGTALAGEALQKAKEQGLGASGFVGASVESVSNDTANALRGIVPATPTGSPTDSVLGFEAKNAQKTAQPTKPGQPAKRIGEVATTAADDGKAKGNTKGFTSEGAKPVKVASHGVPMFTVADVSGFTSEGARPIKDAASGAKNAATSAKTAASGAADAAKGKAEEAGRGFTGVINRGNGLLNNAGNAAAGKAQELKQVNNTPESIKDKSQSLGSKIVNAPSILKDKINEVRASADAFKPNGNTPGGGAKLPGGVADLLEGSGQYEGPRGDADATKGTTDQGALKEAAGLLKNTPFFK